MKNDKESLYTRSIAADILDMVEEVLALYNIKVPSPEDDERDPEDDVGFYGSTYYDLLDNVESYIYSVLEKCNGAEYRVIKNKFCE